MPLPFVLPLLLLAAPAPEPVAKDVVQTRTTALLAKLREGPGPVRVIVFGDSLTAGWGVEDPRTDPFTQVFAQALRTRYPACRVELIAAGGPGDASDDGVVRVDREVIGRRPDVVVLQFGGNDERLGRSPQELTEGLIGLIRTVTSPPADALCLVGTPPMNDPEPDSPYVRAALAAAEGEGAPVANFDQALRDNGRDFRGPFCWFQHPGSATHVLMARELLRAWERLLGVKQELSVAIEGGVRMLPDETLPPLRVTARNLGVTAVEAEVECGSSLLIDHARLSLAPGQPGEVTPTVALPSRGLSARTQTARWWATGRTLGADAGDIAVKWLSLAPVVVPDVVGDTIDPAKLTWHSLGPNELVLGQDAWEGNEDLSGRFALALQGGQLNVMVEVTDDDVKPAERAAHPSEGDSAEVYLDLRPSADQAKPVYSPEVVLLFVQPPAAGKRGVTWTPLDKMTERLAGISASGERTRNGYAVRLVIPEQALARPGEKDFTGIGFDVGIDDGDGRGSRKCQMMWAGAARNYLNPSAFGALAYPSPTPPRWRMSVR